MTKTKARGAEEATFYKQAREAAKNWDWMQAVLHRGEPCFDIQDDGKFCGRAKAWQGHDEMHVFTPLATLLFYLRANLAAHNSATQKASVKWEREGTCIITCRKPLRVINAFNEHNAQELIDVHNSATADALPFTEDDLAEALQDEWNDWCGDTNTFPSCFDWHGGKGTLGADFKGSKFAANVFAILKQRVSATADAEIPTLDLDASSWEQIKQAASESKWMPSEYMRNDWVSDVCSFLRGDSATADDHRALLMQLHREINLFGNHGVTQETARALRNAALSATADEAESTLRATLEEMRVLVSDEIQHDNGSRATGRLWKLINAALSATAELPQLPKESSEALSWKIANKLGSLQLLRSSDILDARMLIEQELRSETLAAQSDLPSNDTGNAL